jgi:4-methylaminobutanoate oxidase (formaldehyde-forming)
MSDPLPPSPPTLPRHARIVLVGGGIVGCSVAYHLARRGCDSVVLLEQNRLAGGTTWHAAGMVGRLRTSSSMARINDASAKLYARLPEETGRPTDWRQVGSLIVARTEDRLEQLYRTAAMARHFGIDARIISADDARRKWPLMETVDLRGAAWLPDDGKVHPQRTTLALAAGARDRGASLLDNVRVQSLLRRGRRIAGVRTEFGDLLADVVVLCSGMWSRQLAADCQIDVPLFPVEHHYAVSPPIPGAHDDLPCLRDPDGTIYCRSDGQQLVVGAFQKRSRPWQVSRVPGDFSFQLLDPDWPRFRQPLDEARRRIPALRGLRLERFVNGPESFTPDNNFLLGPLPGCESLLVAAGFNSAGIACAGGVGDVLAAWILEGSPPLDVSSVDPCRFGSRHNRATFLMDRVCEVLGLHYQLAWPNREFTSGRGLYQSPLHAQMAGARACFGSRAGFEIPLWFAPVGSKPAMEYSFGRQNWFDQHAAELEAARNGVAVFDLSALALFSVDGPGATAWLGRLCTANIDVSPGTAVQTAMLAPGGTLRSVVRVARIGPDTHYLITGVTQRVSDWDWLQRQEPPAGVRLADESHAWGTLGVIGPGAQALLERLTDTPLDEAGVPRLHFPTLSIAGHPVQLLPRDAGRRRGLELYVQADAATEVHRALLAAGSDLRVRNAGHYAWNSLRLEDGIPEWGVDITSGVTPREAGLDGLLDWSKAGGFVGREALRARDRRPLSRALVRFRVADPDAVLWGGEVLSVDGTTVGFSTSATCGQTAGDLLGLAWIGSADMLATDLTGVPFEILAGRLRYPAHVWTRRSEVA